MRRVTMFAIAASVTAVFAGLSVPGGSQAQPAGGVTAYEGARIIVGDGSAPIEGGTIVVQGTQILRSARTFRYPPARRG